MKLKFKKQQFQEDAVNAVCDVFEGQKFDDGNRYVIDTGNVDDSFNYEVTGFRNNKVTLDDEEILENIQRIQHKNGIKQSEKLEGRYNLTVEMETGTGKTYVYIKTMLELNKKYGWSKFIVVVPSIAIREGVYKTFNITQDHFFSEYGKKIRFFIYNSKELNLIEQFASDANINVMIINTQAFNARGEDARKIYMELDEFQSRRPIDVISKTNPIVIIDEPQSVEGEVTKEKLKDFKPLITIRYSATHKADRIFNMIYRLDAVEAYNKKLVKKISVKGISVCGERGVDSYLYLSRINLSQSKAPTATLEFDYKGKNGIRKVIKEVNEGYDLYENSGQLDEYKGYKIKSIDNEGIEFLNDVSISAGEVIGNVENIEQVRRIQIRETIRTHLERESYLFNKGIKILSLFFIDEVAKYKEYVDNVPQNGVYADIFEEEYNNIIKNYGELDNSKYHEYLKAISAKDTHAGYFSIDKKTNHIIDGSIDKKEKISNDIDAYDLIMKNKEQLLDFKEPVRFIFSHSALREGWDNPNVFQICTLKQSNASDKKRQEIGRGLRLCVDQNGNRMDENVLGENVHNINVLTVIANESYDEFTRTLQDELAKVATDKPRKVDKKLFAEQVIYDGDGNKKIVDDDLAQDIYDNFVRNDYVKCGELTDKYYSDKKNNNIILSEDLEEYKDSIVKILDSIYDPKSIIPENANKQNISVKINRNEFNKKEFQDLWKKINRKSFYTVEFDSEQLVEKAINAINLNLDISKVFVKITKGNLEKIKSKEDLLDNTAFKVDNDGDKKEIIDSKDTSLKIDLIDKIVNETTLTRKTVIDILCGIEKEKFEQFKYNPNEFITKISKLINEQKGTLIIEQIVYKPIEGESGTYESDIFTEPTLKGNSENTIETCKNVFDHLIFDCKVEKDFATELEKADEVIVYTKLPSKFSIPTPVGNYNPDWAIAFKNENVKYIYFIAETKGSLSTLSLRGIESAKIECARRHFKAISNDEVKYDVANTYNDLLEKVLK